MRRTPKLFGLYVVDADGSHLRQLASTADLSRWITGRIRGISGAVWSRDGSKLLFSVDVGPYSCSGDGVYRVGSDGSDLRPLWRKPSRLKAQVYEVDWSPSGDRALFVESKNDGDCYGSHVGPETLMSVTDETPGQTVSLLTTSTFGGASWSADGTQIAYADCEFNEPCNIGVLDPNTRQSHLVTHYKTYTSPYGGFDELPFLWSGNGELILARFLSLFVLNTTDGRTRRVVAAPCPRPNGNCSHSRITLYAVSPDGTAVFDADDVGCTLCEPPTYGPKPVSKRYVVGLADAQLVLLPDTSLPVDDVYLP